MDTFGLVHGAGRGQLEADQDGDEKTQHPAADLSAKFSKNLDKRDRGE
jgi:hypothetical protein